MMCYDEWQHSLNGTGKIGYGTNVANLITGVFIATGQDPASVASCHGKFYMSSTGTLYSLQYYYCLMIHCIARFCRQKWSWSVCKYFTAKFKCRNSRWWNNLSHPEGMPQSHWLLWQGTVCRRTSCVGCYWFYHFQDGLHRLCELIAGFTLSLELSTLSALASGQFASAHERLGRNHPTLGLKDEHLNKKFFSDIIGSEGKLLHVVPFKVRHLCIPPPPPRNSIELDIILTN